MQNLKCVVWRHQSIPNRECCHVISCSWVFVETVPRKCHERRGKKTDKQKQGEGMIQIEEKDRRDGEKEGDESRRKIIFYACC